MSAVPRPLKHKPNEYITSGRFFCSIERQEGEDIFAAVSRFLGDGVLCTPPTIRIRNASSRTRSTKFLLGRASNRKPSTSCSGTTRPGSSSRPKIVHERQPPITV
jgi:hypothetical protein